MKHHPGFVALAFALGLLSSGLPAIATTISITGTGGSNGATGAAGNPGGDGGAGGDGQDVTAVADAPGENNTATAHGGYGGLGGSGGAGLPAGADAGDGAIGGTGGDATARAIGMGASSVTANAVAGGGGGGGAGGSATAPGVTGTSGASGEDGDALAEAALDTDSSTVATGSATAGRYDFLQFFGPGRRSTADATVTNASGAAQSTADATSALESSASAVAAGAGDSAVTAAATARSKEAASASARGTTQGSGAVTVSAIAQGAESRGGATTATAYGSGAGAGPVQVTARAFNGSAPSATAEGHSTGGGDVTVEADVDGPLPYVLQRVDLALHDAVSGSTAGRLTLREQVGWFHDFTGDASASLAATNPGGGALAAEVFAMGGYYGDAVLGDILASSTTGADVSLMVGAGVIPTGGRVVQENRSPGAPPTPSRIYAVSNGGAVKTSVSFGATPGRPGAPLDMVDVATGDTTGALTLEQSARGGFGFPPAFIAPGQLGPGGSGGSARSSLTKDTASAALLLRSSAFGGPASYTATSGGDGTAIVSGSNSAGSARILARAEGGSAYGGIEIGGDAGNAIVEASGSTTGNGHEVVIGQEVPPPELGGPGPRFPLARGGRVFSCSGCPVYGRAGSASSRSTGTADGDSLVSVFDLAIGGDGLTSIYDASGGAGGDATSTATATGGGVSTVKAKSDARGGAGGQGTNGGDAESLASATGRGRVESWASAAGGSLGLDFAANPPPPEGPAGSAVAHASADGASGFARAEALTGRSALPQLRAQSEAQVGSSRDVAAAATHGAALASAPSNPGLEGSAFFTSAPLQQDVDTALAGNQALAETFQGGTNHMLALGHWQGDAGDDPLALSTELEIVMSRNVDAAGKLTLGAFGTSVIGDGFGSLSFSLTKNGVALGNTQTFATLDELMAFFAGTVLDLGLGWKAGDELLAHFDLALDADTHFEMGLAYAAAVPEPSTGLLLVLGLLVIAAIRSRAAFSA